MSRGNVGNVGSGGPGGSGSGEGFRQVFDPSNLPVIPEGFFIDTRADGTFQFSPVSQIPGNVSVAPQLINRGSPAEAPAPVQTFTPSASSQALVQRQIDQINNPTLPAGTEIVPTFIEPQENEFIQQPDQLDAGLGATAQDAQSAQAGTQPNILDKLQTIGAQELDAQTADALGAKDAFTFDPSLLTPEQVENALVSTELERLLDFEGKDDIPDFAKGAFRSANEALNARGLGASSIAAEAITAGIINSALPIAQGNSSVRLQSMLSNQASENVARQINAQSKNQVQQFYDSLKTQIDQFNAGEVNRIEVANLQADLTAQIESSRQTLSAATTEAQITAATDQLNAQLTTQAALQNAQLQTQVDQFNAQLRDSREKFNTQNQLVIEQSNVQWRRAINTANTATDNAANQANASNLLGLSNFALASLWQQWRDEAYWAFVSSENIEDRDHNLTIAAFNRDSNMELLDQQSDNNFASGLGQFAFNIIGGALGDFDFSTLGT